jgi:hypothetical protein
VFAKHRPSSRPSFILPCHFGFQVSLNLLPRVGLFRNDLNASCALQLTYSRSAQARLDVYWLVSGSIVRALFNKPISRTQSWSG